MIPPSNFYWFRKDAKHMSEPWLDQALMESHTSVMYVLTTWLFAPTWPLYVTLDNFFVKLTFFRWRFPIWQQILADRGGDTWTAESTCVTAGKLAVVCVRDTTAGEVAVLAINSRVRAILNETVVIVIIFKECITYQVHTLIFLPFFSLVLWVCKECNSRQLFFNVNWNAIILKDLWNMNFWSDLKGFLNIPLKQFY